MPKQRRNYKVINVNHSHDESGYQSRNHCPRLKRWSLWRTCVQKRLHETKTSLHVHSKSTLKSARNCNWQTVKDPNNSKAKVFLNGSSLPQLVKTRGPKRVARFPFSIFFLKYLSKKLIILCSFFRRCGLKQNKNVLPTFYWLMWLLNHKLIDPDINLTII
jgi:hypothetical protein